MERQDVVLHQSRWRIPHIFVHRKDNIKYESFRAYAFERAEIMKYIDKTIDIDKYIDNRLYRQVVYCKLRG